MRLGHYMEERMAMALPCRRCGGTQMRAAYKTDHGGRERFIGWKCSCGYLLKSSLGDVPVTGPTRGDDK